MKTIKSAPRLLNPIEQMQTYPRRYRTVTYRLEGATRNNAHTNILLHIPSLTDTKLAKHWQAKSIMIMKTTVIPTTVMRITTTQLIIIPIERLKSAQALHAQYCHTRRAGRSFIRY